MQCLAYAGSNPVLITKIFYIMKISIFLSAFMDSWEYISPNKVIYKPYNVLDDKLFTDLSGLLNDNIMLFKEGRTIKNNGKKTAIITLVPEFGICTLRDINEDCSVFFALTGCPPFEWENNNVGHLINNTYGTHTSNNVVHIRE